MSAVVLLEKNIFAHKGAKLGTDRMVVEALVKITAQAKLLAPIDKAQLANSIMWKTQKATNGFNKGRGLFAPLSEKLSLNIRAVPGIIFGIVGTNSDHWYPEFGTRNQVAQPFLRPAKSYVLDGVGAEKIALLYGPAAMQEAFNKRKKEVKKFK